jgi:hypothetical protein
LSRKKSKTMLFNGVVVPASLTSSSKTRKGVWGDKWILTTKSRTFIALFSTEQELDSWWIAFQKSQGREPVPSKLSKSLIPRMVPPSVRLPIRRADKDTHTAPTLTKRTEGGSMPDWDFD